MSKNDEKNISITLKSDEDDKRGQECAGQCYCHSASSVDSFSETDGEVEGEDARHCLHDGEVG